MNEDVDKSEAFKKLFSWDGWKSEVPWLILIIFIAISAYSYSNEMDICREIALDPCSVCLTMNHMTLESIGNKSYHVGEIEMINTTFLESLIIK